MENSHKRLLLFSAIFLGVLLLFRRHEDVVNVIVPQSDQQAIRKDLEESLRQDALREFENLIENTLRSLPHEDVVKEEIKLTGAHHTPISIVQASYRIQQITDMLEENPTLEKAGQSFFKR